jgi:hypothetical protein
LQQRTHIPSTGACCMTNCSPQTAHTRGQPALCGMKTCNSSVSKSSIVALASNGLPRDGERAICFATQAKCLLVTPPCANKIESNYLGVDNQGLVRAHAHGGATGDARAGEGLGACEHFVFLASVFVLVLNRRLGGACSHCGTNCERVCTHTSVRSIYQPGREKRWRRHFVVTPRVCLTKVNIVEEDDHSLFYTFLKHAPATCGIMYM